MVRAVRAKAEVTSGPTAIAEPSLTIGRRRRGARAGAVDVIGLLALGGLFTAPSREMWAGQAAVTAILVATLYLPGDAGGLNRLVEGLIGGVTALLVVGVFPRSAGPGPPSW